jgi:dipeptidyl aminopeptidase/acylaminoacyl peptidase
MLLPLLFLITQAVGLGADALVGVEAYFSLKHVTEVEVAADGRAVAFIVTGADVGDDRYRDRLYVWEVRSGAQPLALQFTDARAPRWSPDGEWLTFIATDPADTSADAQPQLWAAPRFGDQPLRLGAAAGAVADYAWAPDGVIYAIADSADRESRSFWRIEVPAGTAEHLWGVDPGARQMALSPDGSQIAFSSNSSSSADNYLNYDIWLLDIEGQATRRLTSRAGPEVSPVWAPDGHSIVFSAPQSTRLVHSQTELFRVSAAGGAPQLLTGAFDRSVIQHRWPTAGELMFTAAVGTYPHLFVRRTDGAIEGVLSAAFNFGPFDARGVGSTIYTVRESASQAPELWRLAGADAEQLTTLNPQTAGWSPGRQSLIQWTAPDGLAIEGLLVFPAEYSEGDRYPLLVNPGGGQGTRARNVLTGPGGYHLFSAQGYAVLTANVRGSIGYGEGFLTARRNDMAGGELTDLLAGIDYLIELGIADSTRLAVFGQGYSGYSAARAVTRTRRFDAAVAHFDYDEAELQLEQNLSTPLLLIDAAAEIAAAERGPHADSDIFFRTLRWFDRYLKFDGADIFDFYLVGEWVTGPNGWQSRVQRTIPDAGYSGLEPDDGRYLEIVVDFRPDPDAQRVRTLELDPTAAISLVAPDRSQLRTAGVVTEIFGREALASDSTTLMSIAPPTTGTSLVSLRLAFEVPHAAAEYRLRIAGFAPIRIWVPGGS